MTKQMLLCGHSLSFGSFSFSFPSSPLPPVTFVANGLSNVKWQMANVKVCRAAQSILIPPLPYLLTFAPFKSLATSLSPSHSFFLSLFLSCNSTCLNSSSRTKRERERDLPCERKRFSCSFLSLSFAAHLMSQPVSKLHLFISQVQRKPREAFIVMSLSLSLSLSFSFPCVCVLNMKPRYECAIQVRQVTLRITACGPDTFWCLCMCLLFNEFYVCSMLSLSAFCSMFYVLFVCHHTTVDRDNSWVHWLVAEGKKGTKKCNSGNWFALQSNHPYIGQRGEGGNSLSLSLALSFSLCNSYGHGEKGLGDRGSFVLF